MKSHLIDLSEFRLAPLKKIVEMLLDLSGDEEVIQACSDHEKSCLTRLKGIGERLLEMELNRDCNSSDQACLSHLKEICGVLSDLVGNVKPTGDCVGHKEFYINQLEVVVERLLDLVEESDQTRSVHEKFCLTQLKKISVRLSDLV